MIEMDSKTLSNVIREAIVERNLSAYALGKLADVSPVVIQRFLSGERGLTLATADKLAQVLKLHLCHTEMTEPEVMDSEIQGEAHSEARLLRTANFDLQIGGTIRIGDGITVQLVQIGPRSVRLVIECPPEIAVMRGERAEAIAVANREHRRAKPQTGTLA